VKTAGVADALETEHAGSFDGLEFVIRENVG
jgi:hypothetical protein